MKSTSQNNAKHHARVSARTEHVIGLLLSGKGPNEIVAETGISRTTIFRMRKSDEFKAKFEEAKRGAFDSCVNALHDSALTFVRTLHDVCVDPKSRDSARATAARSGLDSLFRVSELFDLQARIRKLEEAAAESSQS